MKDAAKLISRAVNEFQTGNYHKAERNLVKAIKIQPANVDLSIMAGLCCFNQEKFKQSVQHFERARKLAPEHPIATGNLGLAYVSLGRVDDAIPLLKAALREQPDEAEFALALAQALGQTGDAETALEVLHDIATKTDANPFAKASVGRFLRELKDYESSYNVLKELVSSYQDFGDGHAEFAYTCRDLGDLEMALSAIDRAIELEPDEPRYHHNRGIILRYLKRLDEAVAAVETGLALAPDDADLKLSMSVNLFLLQRFEEAWPYFEARWDKQGMPRRRKVWNGEALDGKSLIVRREQGVGDEILFSTCLPDLATRAGDDKVFVECDPRLKGLFERTYPGGTFLSRLPSEEDSVHGREFDLEIGFGSLLPLFRTTLADIENSHPRRLIPDPALVETWQQRLSQVGSGLKVGIAWRGGATPLSKKSRSVELTEMAPILGIAGCHFINLQYGDTANEIAAFTKEFGIEIYDWPDVDPMTDLEGQTAQIAALDLVIQVSNVSAHIAGLLGKPVWVLQAEIPFWPWFVDREDMPWYFDVTQFRMNDLDNKAEVISKIAARLKQKAEGS